MDFITPAGVQTGLEGETSCGGFDLNEQRRASVASWDGGIEQRGSSVAPGDADQPPGGVWVQDGRLEWRICTVPPRRSKHRTGSVSTHLKMTHQVGIGAASYGRWAGCERVRLAMGGLEMCERVRLAMD